VTDRDPVAACQSCRREYPPEELDHNGWCPPCKARVIRRATWIGRMAGVCVAVLLGMSIAIFVQPTRFVAGWAALLVGTYFVLMKLVRRVVVELRVNRRLRTGHRVK
jgi:predicted RNA-binding Zn-ribbon protein involved in translation (DUF1610 family)